MDEKTVQCEMSGTEEKKSKSDDEMNACLSSALDAGALLLMYGAEVSRVEDTITRLCRAYGFAGADVFTITSSIVATASFQDGRKLTQTRRIRDRVNDFGRVEKINALSRQLCSGQIGAEEFRSRIQQVRDDRGAPQWLNLCMYMLISASLSVFFGGTWADGAAAALSGMVLFGMIRMSAVLRMNSMVQAMVCSAVTALAVLLLVEAGIGSHPDKIMIGNIMLVIPGIQLTSSLRDMINGDTISGLLNMCEALLKAISVALGFTLVLIVVGG